MYRRGFHDRCLSFPRRPQSPLCLALLSLLENRISIFPDQPFEITPYPTLLFSAATLHCISLLTCHTLVGTKKNEAWERFRTSLIPPRRRSLPLPRFPGERTWYSSVGRFLMGLLPGKGAVFVLKRGGREGVHKCYQVECN